MIDQAIKLGHEVVAITEHETIASAIDAENYYNKIKKDNPNFKVILGNEIYLCRNGLNPRNYDTSQDKWYHFILLAKDEIGHKQIRELSTRAWMRAEVYRKMMRVPTYYQDLYDIIGKNPGHVIASTACFRAGTQVETKNEWKNIEDIQAGDLVINKDGEWEEVLEPTSMLTHQYGYEIELTGCERKVVCTDNHEFLVISNNNKTPRWVQAKNLDLTPRSGKKHIALEPVVFNYNQSNIIKREEWNNSYLKQNQFSHRKIFLPDEIVITPELMRLFGLFLGDGCISLEVNPAISFTFNEKEYDNYMDSFINEASRQLGITWSVTKRPDHHRVDIGSGSTDLINLFYYLFGNVKANSKYVPDRLRISKELDCELVFGYLLADGYFRTRNNAGVASGYICGEFTSASISKQLSYDLYNLLNQLHITSSISLCKGKIRDGVNHQDAWYVSGANKELGVVNKLIPYSHEDIVDIFNKAAKAKEKDFIVIDGIVYRKVRFKSAKKIELNERVYCLNNTTHSFKCENVIVHNCLGGALPTQILRNRERGDNSLWDKIKLWCTTLNNLFKGDFYLEMQPSNNEEQIYVNNKIIELSEELNIPFIITNDAHYLNKTQRPIHKAFLNAKDGDREVDDFYATTYLMDDIELKSFMEKHIGLENMEKAYKSIREIKNKCQDYSLKKPLKIPRLSWKQYRETEQLEEWLKRIPMLKTFLNSEYSEDVHLAKVVIDILEHNPMNDETLNTQATYDELNACFDDIWVSSEANNARWSAYLLNLQNIIDLCWEAGSLVGPGRGSGVGFLLLYILGITQINPLREKAKTFRFRFLNPKRVSPLD